MKLDNNGFGSPTLYAIAGLLVLLVIAGSVIMAQRATIKMYKAENVRLATDNVSLEKAKENQHNADVAALKRCEKAKNELLIKLGQCQEPTIITGCPTITIEQWEVVL
jgi:hypothetical protein